MRDKARYVLAGALMAVMGNVVFELISKDWRAAVWLVVGFVTGVLWWACIAPDWAAAEARIAALEGDVRRLRLAMRILDVPPRAGGEATR